MDIEKVALGKWKRLMKSFVESEDFDYIFAQLKQAKNQGKIICPESKDLWKVFQLCPPEKVKCIIVLQDPYPTVKDGVMVADGVPLSCSYTNYPQPSLQVWWKMIEEVFFDSLALDLDMRSDLSFYLKEEGIFLINSSLTVLKDQSSSHTILWEKFMNYFFGTVINQYFSGLPIVFLGAQGAKYERLITPLLHHTLITEHPVAPVYRGGNSSWKHQDFPKWINNIIKNSNGIESVPRWYRLTTDTEAPW